jgi:formylmethanofuran dehydrogenase subunit B
VAPNAGQDFAALWLLRALVRARPIDPFVPTVGGRSIADWKAFAERLKASRYGVVVLPPGLPARVVEATHALATDLNDFTRVRVLELAEPGNGVGAEQVLTWLTGYGQAVGLHAGFPRSFGGEYGAARILARQEADAILSLGDSSLLSTSQAIPTVALSSQIALLPEPPMVAITTTPCAIDRPATAFRIDGLALPLRPAISSSFPDDFQVLKRIERAVRRKAAPG